MPIYVHQINRLRQGRTAELYDAVEQSCLPAYVAQGLRLLGYWETVPGQGPWPETIELWELDDLEHYRRFLQATYEPRRSDLREWLDAKTEWVQSSESLLCFPIEGTPTVADLEASGFRSKFYIHELIETLPNRQRDYSECVRDMWWERCAKPAGRLLVGLYYCPWKNTRSFNIWGVGEEWEDCSLWGTGDGWDSRDTDLWNSLSLAVRTDFDDRFLVPAPFSTVR